MTSIAPPFAAQRMVCLALVIGMTMYAIAAGFIIQSNDGVGLLQDPIVELDLIVWIVAGGCAVGAFGVRAVMTSRANAATQPGPRGTFLFLSRLMPIAMIEAACLLAITTWMLHGEAVPGLAVACVLLSLAIALVPFSDPDETSAGPVDPRDR